MFLNKHVDSLTTHDSFIGLKWLTPPSCEKKGRRFTIISTPIFGLLKIHLETLQHKDYNLEILTRVADKHAITIHMTLPTQTGWTTTK